MEGQPRVTRWLGLTSLTCMCGIAAIGWRDVLRRSVPDYTIAFKSFAPNNTDIFIADADGAHARALVPDSSLDYNASYSSDGHWIIFTSHRSGPAKIYRVHLDVLGLERLTDGPAFDDQAALSPDGKTLAFVSSRSGQADICTLDLATRELFNVTRHPAGDFRPAWSPDGRWLAFSSDRDPDGSDVRLLTDNSTEEGAPSWIRSPRR